MAYYGGGYYGAPAYTPSPAGFGGAWGGAYAAPAPAPAWGPQPYGPGYAEPAPSYDPRDAFGTARHHQPHLDQPYAQPPRPGYGYGQPYGAAPPPPAADNEYGSGYPRGQPPRAPAGPGSRPQGGGLRESDLQRHNQQHHHQHGPRGAPSATREREYVIDLDARSEGVASTASATSVGESWRSLTKKNGKRKSVHPSRVPPPWGQRMALCVGVDDETRAATNACAAVHSMLARRRFTVETVVDTGDHARFDQEVETALVELIALSRAGDSIVIYAYNYNGAEHSASELIERMAQSLRQGTRVTFVLDSCHLTSRPAYRMDHRQQRIPSAKYAGLKHHRRLAKPMGPVNVTVAPDLFCFVGDNPSRRPATFTKASGSNSVYTEAFVRAFTDQERRGPTGKLTFADLSYAIETELARIKFPGRPHNTSSEIYCTKAYDIDQPCHI